MIEWNCSSCGKRLSVREEMAGKTGKCPACNTAQEIPLSRAQALELLDRSVAEWNEYRAAHPQWVPDLGEAVFNYRSLGGVDFSKANLKGACFFSATLSRANLGAAILQDAQCTGAALDHANLYRVDACGAIFRRANLSGANFHEADLRRADLTSAQTDGADFTDAKLERPTPKSADETIEEKGVPTGKGWQPREVIRAAEQRVVSVVFAPDGASVATGSTDCSVRLFAVDSGASLLTCKLQHAIRCVAFAPRGRLLAIAEDYQNPNHPIQIILLGLKVDSHGAWSARVRGRLYGDAGVVGALSFSPDELMVACANTRSCSKSVMTWEVPTGAFAACLAVDPDHVVHNLAFAPKGATLATAAGNAVRLWDPVQWSELAVFEIPHGHVYSVAFSPGGGQLAAGGDGVAVVWDLASSRRVAILKGHSGTVRHVAFLGDRKTLLTVARPAETGAPCEVRVWDVGEAKPLASVVPPARIWSAAAAPNGNGFATAHADGTIKLWCNPRKSAVPAGATALSNVVSEAKQPS
jgi:uncharacterized protein YjbI with pentapeptide repeats